MAFSLFAKFHTCRRDVADNKLKTIQLSSSPVGRLRDSLCRWLLPQESAGASIADVIDLNNIGGSCRKHPENGLTL